MTSSPVADLAEELAVVVVVGAVVVVVTGVLVVVVTGLLVVVVVELVAVDLDVVVVEPEDFADLIVVVVVELGGGALEVVDAEVTDEVVVVGWVEVGVVPATLNDPSEIFAGVE